MKVKQISIFLLMIGILLLAIGVGLWQYGSSAKTPVSHTSSTRVLGERGTTTVTTIYKSDQPKEAAGLGLAVIGLGSAVTGGILLLKKKP